MNDRLGRRQADDAGHRQYCDGVGVSDGVGLIDGVMVIVAGGRIGAIRTIDSFCSIHE
ncbi:MAG: hypothetical protein ABI629_23415 [bacterium]